MRILYAIQGTGNGHISRAKEIIPALMNRAQVDILVSGTQSDIDLPFPITYKLKGISFVFGKKGGIDYLQTLKINNVFRVLKEIKSCNVGDYDLIINDFEPITAWACRLKRYMNCVSLSHQGALLSHKVPKPKSKSWIGQFILKYYAPTSVTYGVHFKAYDKSIYPAVIRRDIRWQSIKEKNYYVVYLPAYSDKKILKVLTKIKDTKFKVFSKEAKEAYRYHNVKVKPINATSFERSMAWSKGVICGAGFETPAEALFLRKKLMVVPMKGQYEQAYNAESLRQLGVPVITSFHKSKLFEIIKWIDQDKRVELNFPDKTQFIVDDIITNHIVATELQERLFEL